MQQNLDRVQEWGCSSVGMAKQKQFLKIVFVCNILAALTSKGSVSNRGASRHPRRMVHSLSGSGVLFFDKMYNGAVAQLGERMVRNH